ncbi:hypothetical protein HF1_09530 [Mycoplasma haemofelis str. Langford 1]|uniref:Uncharacterized protein n=2 Tax=Mycoplasma haemofelis TaxID=29501 RepID=F6FJ92_MYCHI|nr:hypothetical protein [Mycoplasma haemofelis]AEG73290.1 hypothetical protein MHF_1040 [Mycoplasma haemofelis Ohio2]CBY92961.1 hypothetical protein HF1_09530 [Mycoplasma haemofelis str. Langford 1]
MIDIRTFKNVYIRVSNARNPELVNLLQIHVWPVVHDLKMLSKPTFQLCCDCDMCSDYIWLTKRSFSYEDSCKESYKALLHHLHIHFNERKLGITKGFVYSVVKAAYKKFRAVFHDYEELVQEKGLLYSLGQESDKSKDLKQLEWISSMAIKVADRAKQEEE